RYTRTNVSIALNNAVLLFLGKTRITKIYSCIRTQFKIPPYQTVTFPGSVMMEKWINVSTVVFIIQPGGTAWQHKQ
ncbi:MAG TPA: hypothetical protein DDY37_04025, partial [Legionella sp.]|nr:hypothetical protein [Legionella sp.]